MKRKLIFYFTDRRFLSSFLVAVLMFLVSIVINYYAGIFATTVASNPITDIVLSNIPPINLSPIFVYAPIIFWVFIAFLLLKQPERIPFSLKTISLFIVVRAAFVSMTHLGQVPGYITPTSNFLVDKLAFGGDLFFSGHTGLPFLMALIFWDNKILRRTFTLIAAFFGVVVLLGHYHYTIDVASAFFITYGIHRLAQIFFPRDEKLFKEVVKEI